MRPKLLQVDGQSPSECWPDRAVRSRGPAKPNGDTRRFRSPTGTETAIPTSSTTRSGHRSACCATTTAHWSQAPLADRCRRDASRSGTGGRRKSNAALTQWRTTPSQSTSTATSKLDLVALDQEGYLTLRSTGRRGAAIFVDEDNQPLRLNRKIVRRIRTGEIGRGRLGRRRAARSAGQFRKRDLVSQLRRHATARSCLKKIGNLARRNVAGHTSSPAVCDFDGTASRTCWSAPRTAGSTTSTTTTACSIPTTN